MFLLHQFIIVSPLKKVKGKLDNARRGILAIIRSYLILDTYIYAANKYQPFKIKNNTGYIFHISSQT